MLIKVCRPRPPCAHVQIAALQSPEGDLLCFADAWRVANELSNAASAADSAGWFSVADGTVSGTAELCRKAPVVHTRYKGNHIHHPVNMCLLLVKP